MNLADFAPGSKNYLALPVTTTGGSTELPAIVLKGALPGRTLAITAGVHGDEYEGVRAIFDTLADLKPAQMQGNLLCVPVANPPAFWNVSRTSPDGGNLARVFPGRPDGSLTEAIAFTIAQEVLPQADLYLDLHSAGVRFLMPTLAGYELGDARGEAAARAFGAPVLWAHDVIPPGRTISSAREQGVPWLYTEARGAGRIHPDDLRVYRRGIQNLLRHLNILAGEPEISEPEHELQGDGNVDASIAATVDGFLLPEVDVLDDVVEGQVLGTLADVFGRPLETFTAPRAGVVALIHICPVVRQQEPVFLITGRKH